MKKYFEDGQSSVATSARGKKIEIFNHIEETEICEFVKRQVRCACEIYLLGETVFCQFQSQINLINATFWSVIKETFDELNEDEVDVFVDTLVHREIDNYFQAAA